MVNIARKNLFADVSRLVISVGGVGFSIFLIMFLLGLTAAIRELSIDYVQGLDADVVIAQEGIKDMYHYPSLLPEGRVKQVARITVGDAQGLMSWITNAKVREEDGSRIVDFAGRDTGTSKKGKMESLILIGFDTASGVGGPKIILEGERLPGKRQIVVDKVLAQRNKLGLGDQIEVANQIFTISGITDKNNVMTMTRAFVELGEAQDALNQKGNVNFILVKLPEGTDAQVAASKAQADIPGISAFSRDEFVIENARMVDDNFLPILLVVAGIGLVTGGVVVGITIYTATMERIKEYGVLKAIGVSNGKLFRIVFEQAMWATIIGFGIGVLLLVGVRLLAEQLVPILAVKIDVVMLAIGLGMAVVMSLLSCYIPIKRIARIDPVDIFRS